MKLAFCLFKYFPYGGLQRDFLQIARECVRRGHTVDVYTMQWDGDRDPNIAVQVILPSAWQNHTRSESFVAQIKPFLEEEKYDLVIGFNKMPGLDVYFAADTCYQAKARVTHNWFYRLTPRYRHHITYENAVFGPNSKTEILLLSANQKTEFIKHYKTPNKRFHLLPPGIDKSRIAPTNAQEIRHAVRKEFQIEDTDFLLLMVGSGFKTKGLDRILAALHALPPKLKKHCHLFIVGKDNPEHFEKLAEKLDVEQRVKFLGGRNDVPRLLLAADLLLHPAYNENTGTVLIEAMVAGLPVLTTDVCGYAHYVEETNAGIVLPSPYKQHVMNKTLVDMLFSTQRDEWSQNGKAFSNRDDIYSMHKRAADFIELKLNIVPPLQELHGGGALYLIPSLEQHFSSSENIFDKIMSLQGEVYRELEGRRTQRIVIDDEAYFIKQHFGVGWKEIFKNLTQLKLPVISAKNEWQAMQRAKRLGIPTLNVVGYGYRGTNPATLQSFLITKELPNAVSLEDLTKAWATQKPDFKFKKALIKEIARIARLLHQNGINHRDFYLCHFLVNPELTRQSAMPPGLMPVLPKNDSKQAITLLYLIDLHRAQIRSETPLRWIIKDLAGLYFSSKEIGLTSRDLLRFIKEYRKMPLRDVFPNEAVFWRKVRQRGNDLYQAHHP